MSGRQTQPSVDREMRTPRTSGSFSALRDLAAAVVDDLAARRGTLLGDALIRRAEALRDEFESWPANPPDVERRSASIQQLIELREQVTAYLHGR